MQKISPELKQKRELLNNVSVRCIYIPSGSYNFKTNHKLHAL
jgi:hypothetical protein